MICDLVGFDRYPAGGCHVALIGMGGTWKFADERSRASLEDLQQRLVGWIGLLGNDHQPGKHLQSEGADAGALSG